MNGLPVVTRASSSAPWSELAFLSTTSAAAIIICAILISSSDLGALPQQRPQARHPAGILRQAGITAEELRQLL